MSKPEVNADKIRSMEQTARTIGKILVDVCQIDGNKYGFALFLFGFGSEPEFTYISNANRQDMVKTMQEFIDRNPPDKTWDQQTLGEQRGH